MKSSFLDVQVVTKVVLATAQLALSVELAARRVCNGYVLAAESILNHFVSNSQFVVLHRCAREDIFVVIGTHLILCGRVLVARLGLGHGLQVSLDVVHRLLTRLDAFDDDDNSDDDEDGGNDDGDDEHDVGRAVILSLNLNALLNRDSDDLSARLRFIIIDQASLL